MKKIKKGFTLIELMIVIAMIGIIFVWMRNINFNYMSDRQKAEQFANKIISQIETARNNAMIGRSVTDPDTWEKIIPDFWSIRFTSKHATLPTLASSTEVRFLKKNQKKEDFWVIDTYTGKFWLLAQYSPPIAGDKNHFAIIDCGFPENNTYLDMFLTFEKQKIIKDSSCNTKDFTIKVWYKDFKYQIKVVPVTWIITKELQ